MQGQLRQAYVSVEVETPCAHCNQVMHFTLDSALRFSVHDATANPVVFMPEMDWDNFAERTIIDAY